MIITQTPLRISFAGGGTDMKGYYAEGGGAVISSAIDKYIFMSSSKSALTAKSASATRAPKW